MQIKTFLNKIDSLSCLSELTDEIWSMVEFDQRGLILLDLDFNVFRINEAARRIFRRENDRTLRPLSQVAPMIPLAELKNYTQNIAMELNINRQFYLCSWSPLTIKGKSNGYILILEEEDDNRYVVSDNDQVGKQEDGFIQDFIAESDGMRRVTQLAARAALTDVTVLIQGESGTGKEIIASAIHHSSKRAKTGKLIKLNCGAIPDNLIESELFGYEPGAFSGASSKGKPGMFELANHGTLFLDEVGDLPLQHQVKLLRALQEKEAYRVGGVRPIKFDSRIIAATNQDIWEMVQEGLFREDLFYRLNVFPLEIPPLRERRTDIPLLALYFIEMYNNYYHTSKRLTDKGISLLESSRWPGNVRELKNFIEHLVVSSDRDIITATDIRYRLEKSGAEHEQKQPISVNAILPLREAKSYVEKEMILLALRNSNSVRRASSLLGIDHSNLLRKINDYNINIDDYLMNNPV